MKKYFFDSSKRKYDILKKNVRLMKVKNKQAEEKINFKRNDIKRISKKYLYSQNDFMSFHRLSREISMINSIFGLTALSMVAMSKKTRRCHNYVKELTK